MNIFAMTSSSGLGKALLLSSHIPAGLQLHANTPANNLSLLIYHNVI